MILAATNEVRNTQLTGLRPANNFAVEDTAVGCEDLPKAFYSDGRWKPTNEDRLGLRPMTGSTLSSTVERRRSRGFMSTRLVQRLNDETIVVVMAKALRVVIVVSIGMSSATRRNLP